MRIDAHQHFWNFDPVRDSWINNDMAVIQRDFLPEDLSPVLQQYKMDGCIAVQADQTEQQNDFLLNLATGNDFVKGIVGWVDLRSDAVEDRLSHYSNESKMKGFRHVLQGEAQRDLMLQPAFMNGISKLGKFGFTYDVLIFPDQLQFTEMLVKAFPNQKFVLDHIAKPDIKGQSIADWKAAITAVARHENVYCKVSGMVTEADWRHWKQEDFTPYLDVVFEAFGTGRLMFGSDWPVCLVAGGYDGTVEIMKKFTAELSADEQAQFWGNNAAAFYNLDI